MKTHYPPSGWGCKCRVFGSTRKEYATAEEAGLGEAPSSPIDPKTGAPVGIDKGWDYNVGEAAWGQNRAKVMMEDKGAWKDIHPWGPEKYGRPERIEVDTPEAMIGRPVAKGDADALRKALRTAIGGDAAFFADPLGETTLVNQAITDHILQKLSRQDGREAYFPFIPELIERPFEIWVNFAKMRYQDGLWISGDFFRGGLTGAGNLRKGRLLYGRD